jgi:hypothetical protein
MSRRLISLAVLAALLAAGAADAQEKSKKLYRWVDRDGKVQFSDTLPPEAIDQARTEMSDSGRVVADVDRALTEEERAAAAIAAAEAARREAEAEQTRKSEEAMLSSFQTEDELRRSMQERVTLLQQTLAAIEAGIASQRASLTALLQQATDIELAGAQVGAVQAATIRELHDEITKQQQMLVVKQSELEDADENLERLVLRFRELKAEAAGIATPPAGAPEDAASPDDADAEAPATGPAPEGAAAG